MTKHSNKLFIIALLVLSFVGFIDAAYLTANHYLKVPLPCSLTQGCDIVLLSKYATLGPIPISVFGVFYYLAILFLAVYVFTSDNPSRKIAKIILAVTSAGLLASAFLVYLQFFVIRALCLYCLFSAVITVLLFAASIKLTLPEEDIKIENF